MLDVITDFWKPVKKNAANEKPDVERLQVGSSLTFGTVPQSNISGRSFKVTAVNTYQFGEERMTSFVITGERDESLSLIVASPDGEPYLALSRRISFSDRMRMFDPAELEAVVEQPDAARLLCREIDANWKHWVVANYKKEISGLKGSVTKGDYRNQPLTAEAPSQDFDYLLLTSENNEYAIEVERYADGRIELFATVYRRVTDIVELENPQTTEPRLTASTAAPALEVVNPASTGETLAQAVEAAELKEEKPEDVMVDAPASKEEKASAPETKTPEAPVAQGKPVETPPVKPEAPLFNPAKVIAKAEEKTKVEEKISAKPEPAAKTAASPAFFQNKTTTESPAMQANYNANTNGAANPKQEIKAVNTQGEFENDAIECDLRVANKIIEEAIRNEMRLSDIVRRIIALPVANPESVHIPVTLGDADFQLLAIRYGLPASDRNAIKNRIIEEINDFSGKKN